MNAKISLAGIFPGIVLVGLVACTTETIVAAPAPSAPPAATADPGVPPPKPQPASADWTESAVPSDVRSLSCPTDGEAHAATAAGLFHFDGTAWTLVAPGDFSGVHLADATNGFAVGDGVMAQRLGATWSSVQVKTTWKMRGVYTEANGAWISGDGFDFAGANGVPLSPKVIFVEKTGGGTPAAKMYGDQLTTAGSAATVSGSGGWVSANGPQLLALWNGTAWATVEGMELSNRRSVVVAGDFVFATDGKDIHSVMATSDASQQLGSGRDVFTGTTSSIQMLIPAPNQSFVALGDDGLLSQWIYDAGKLEDLDPPASIPLTAGCATSDGHLWVSAGKRVFRRNDAL